MVKPIFVFPGGNKQEKKITLNNMKEVRSFIKSADYNDGVHPEKLLKLVVQKYLNNPTKANFDEGMRFLEFCIENKKPNLIIQTAELISIAISSMGFTLEEKGNIYMTFLESLLKTDKETCVDFFGVRCL